jgi:hypothetical protein
MPSWLAPTSRKRGGVEDDIDDPDIDLDRATVRELIAARALTDDQLWHLRGWPSADEDPAVARTRDDLLRLRASIDQALLAGRERDRTLAVPHHDATSSEMSVPLGGPGAAGRPPAVARPS